MDDLYQENKTWQGFTRSQRIYLPFKRLFDIVFSLIALVVFSPLFLVVAVAVKVDSRGPVFYVQKARVGKDGKLFPMYKFRSMINKADEMKESLKHLNEMEGPVFKLKNDPRLTKVGRFIRKYSIDEMPQFVNVLLGHMSIVGPRPFLETEIEESTCGRHRIHSKVRPGLTCVWAVNGRSNAPSFEQRMSMDMEYVGRFDPMLDFVIVCKTIPVVFSGDGAS
ncbi:MAG: sugar transferase [Oscillospiraceae bacterium]|jgi:lipopolysaccharide/colanic/teichoic acid biosynthesis glycosyltransferase|nr:sugar transferase [Oscillospiraceae bacterium]